MRCFAIFVAISASKPPWSSLALLNTKYVVKTNSIDTKMKGGKMRIDDKRCDNSMPDVKDVSSNYWRENKNSKCVLKKCL